MLRFSLRCRRAAVVMAAMLAAFCGVTAASDFSQPWKRKDRALVVDAYEYNAIGWDELASDKRIVGFINKASDGLSPPYACTGTETEERLCGALWKRHAVARELFHTRRAVAKALGLKWGAYHLGRPGNPIDQANHFLDFAEPEPDDLLAIDIEDNDPEKWMSLEDAEAFARHIHRRIGRFPILYTNGSTARHIADRRDRYRLLSRLPLWYARYASQIGMHFPKGNWETYTLWQFASQSNCNRRRCPYRVPGTNYDIDVNVAAMDAATLRKAWPFGGLVDAGADLIASVPVPIARDAALRGSITLTYARVAMAVDMSLLKAAFALAGNRYPRSDVSAVPDLALAYLEGGDRYPEIPSITVTRTSPPIDLAFTTSIGSAAGRAQAAIRDWLAAGATAALAPRSTELVGGVPTTP